MTVSFRVKVLASHALVALLVGAVTLVIVDRLVARRLEQQVDHRLEVQGRGVAQWMQRAQHPSQLARRLADVVAARVTILDRAGVAIGESDGEPGTPPGASADGQAAEVVAARARGVGHATRFSAVRGEPVRYVALEADDGRVVRLGLPIGEINQVKDELRRQLGGAALVSFLVALGLAAVVAGPLTRRLRDATAVARRIGAGDYDVPAPPAGGDELGVLSHALATAGAELRAAERRRRDFLADVAHELRTPVTSIRLLLESLRDDRLPLADRDKVITLLAREVARLDGLLLRTLELSRLEAGRHAFDLRPIAVADLVAEAVSAFDAATLAAPTAIQLELEPDLKVVADRETMARALVNLLVNAWKYSDGERRISVTARGVGRRVELVVKDNGIGIAPGEHERLFEVFERSQAAVDRGAPGVGLGLAIVRAIVRAHHGKVEVSSVPGAGSEFRVVLPRARPRTQPLALPAQAGAGAGGR